MNTETPLCVYIYFFVFFFQSLHDTTETSRLLTSSLIRILFVIVIVVGVFVC